MTIGKKSILKQKASRYRGVYKCGKKWKSQIQIAGAQVYLGVFDSEEEAAAKYDEAALSHGRNETLNFNLNSNSSSYSEISSESNCQDTGAAIAYDSLDSSNIFNLKLQLGNVIKSCILIRKNILNQLDSAKVLQLMDNLDELNIIKSDLVSKILELDVDDESDHDDTDYESYMNTFVNENYSSVNESLNNSIQSFCFDSLLDHSNQFSIFEV